MKRREPTFRREQPVPTPTKAEGTYYASRSGPAGRPGRKVGIFLWVCGWGQYSCWVTKPFPSVQRSKPTTQQSRRHRREEKVQRKAFNHTVTASTHRPPSSQQKRRRRRAATGEYAHPVNLPTAPMPPFRACAVACWKRPPLPQQLSRAPASYRTNTVAEGGPR